MKYLLCVAALSLAAGVPVVTAATTSQPLDLLRAVERAEKAMPGQVLDVELDRDRRGRLVYDIDVASGGALHEVRINAMDGAVIGQSRERIEGWYRDLIGAGPGKVAGGRPLSATIRDLQARSGGKVISVDFEVEGGQARYEMELSTEAGIAGLYVDPRTGRRLDFVIED